MCEGRVGGDCVGGGVGGWGGVGLFFFFKQKTAYEIGTGDWSSDVCSSDLVDHLDGTAIFVPYLRSLKLENLIFASPDVGGVKRTRSFAKFFGADLVVCDKYRERANEVASMRLIGDVKGKDVVMVDDLIDTGGTMCKAASLLMENGASSVRAVVTHPVLSGKAYDNIDNSVLEELVVSDSIPLRQESKRIRVLTLSDLFARAINNVHTHGSISSLFIQK